MRSALLLLALVLPGTVMAAGGWQASSAGPGVGNRGQMATSPALSPAEPVSGAITQIAWRYVLTGPPPSGLRVYLCAQTRCVALEGASGTTSGLSNIPAGESLHFAYGVEGKGRLPQPLRVLSNQVMVNYQ
uniref:flagellar protein FlhE n=1 Tax=Pantoea sp. IMH TaxID=1267600 RepID=UPI000467FEA4|nr:flagellar protein FlhE [Pantoea sp. IMH]